MNSSGSIYRILCNGAGGFGGVTGGGGPPGLKPPLGTPIDPTRRLGIGLYFAPPLCEGSWLPHNAAELAGNAAATTSTGTLSWAAGKFGTARNSTFKGSTSYDTMNHQAILYDRPWATEIWFNLRTFQTLSPFISALFACPLLGTAGWHIGRMGDPTVGSTKLNIAGVSYSTQTFSAATLYQAIITYDASGSGGTSGRADLYVNGLLDATNASFTVTAGQYFTQTYLFRDDTAGRAPDGTIELIRHWQRYLTADDALSLFGNPMAVYAVDDWDGPTPGPAGAAIVFRKGFSAFYGQAGRRQQQRA